MECFLLKDEQKKQVSVYHRPVPGGKTAVTDYRVLDTRGSLSFLEIGLETGRTHQITRHHGRPGLPLLGDGKYGRGDVNRRYGETRQALYAYQLTFRPAHGCRHPELPPWPHLHRGGRPLFRENTSACSHWRKPPPSSLHFFFAKNLEIH